MTPNTAKRNKIAPVPRRPMVLGLAGGIASGKSTVARMFGDLGAKVIDADAIARRILETPAVCRRLRERWGEKVFNADGRPDAGKIADIVFADAGERAALNAMVHPETLREIQARVEETVTAKTAPLIVIDAPLLFEAKLDATCDHVVFVEASPENRATRANSARGWTSDEVARREAAQDGLARKRERADAIIRNDGGPEETLSQVKRLVRQWTECNPTHNPQALTPGGTDDA